ncbi:MAG: hypothetical protein OQK49_02400, partial [Proteobacteria bacterium]|nr:hypothetical protein [Pseudomonadota bacterium]
NNQGDNELENKPEKVVNVEFFQDIRPILENHCVSCHNGNQNAGNLNLSDHSLEDNLPGDYRRLAHDESADYGHPPVIHNGIWRQTNASRYIRKFQSRRSLLTWKVFGERLDGWLNSDHPTASIPGDDNSLPNGANPDSADLDFIPSSAHPAGGMTELTNNQKMTLARWIDLGAPIDISEIRGNPGMGWFLDDLKPTLTISLPRPNFNPNPVDKIRFGLTDANSGIDLSTLSIKANFSVNSLPAETELSGLAVNSGDGIYQISLSSALPIDTMERHIRAEVADHQGNIKRLNVRFYTGNTDIIFQDSFDG